MGGCSGFICRFTDHLWGEPGFKTPCLPAARLKLGNSHKSEATSEGVESCSRLRDRIQTPAKKTKATAKLRPPSSRCPGRISQLSTQKQARRRTQKHTANKLHVHASTRLHPSHDHRRRKGMPDEGLGLSSSERNYSYQKLHMLATNLQPR